MLPEASAGPIYSGRSDGGVGGGSVARSPEVSGGQIHFGRSDGGLGGGSVHRPPTQETEYAPGGARTPNQRLKRPLLYH